VDPGPAAGTPIFENPVAGLLPGFNIWQPKTFSEIASLTGTVSGTSALLEETQPL